MSGEGAQPVYADFVDGTDAVTHRVSLQLSRTHLHITLPEGETLYWALEDLRALPDQAYADGLVLISPFTSAFSVHSPAQHLLPGDRFPNLRRIRGVECPLLVVHGEADGIIPPSHGRRLVEASPASAKRFHGIAGAGHNDLFRVGGPEILREIEAFVGSLPR